MMSSATEIARNDDVAAFETNKEAASRRVRYGREALLSIAEVEACKNLPCGFDSSIFCEVNYDSTGSRRPVLDSDCCKKERQRTPSQSPAYNHESETSGTPSVLGKDNATIGTLATSIEGGSCSLLRRCVDPYQPPSLRKVKSDSYREYKNSYKHSILGPWTPSILNRDEDESRRKEKPEAGGRTTSNENGEGDIHTSFSERAKSPLSAMSFQLHARAKSRAPQVVLLSPDIEETNPLKEIEHDLSEEQLEQSSDMGANHSLSGSHPGASKLLLSVLTKSREYEDLEDPEADALSPRISETRVNQDFRKDASSPSESNLAEELHSTENIARAVSALTDDDFLGFVAFSYPVRDDIITTVPDEIFTASGEFSLPLSSTSQTGSDLPRSVSDDVPAEFGILTGGEEMKLSSEGDLSYSDDEIFLPDEDSLITLDDLVMSMELVEKPDVKSSEEQSASRTWVNIVKNSSTPNVSYTDDASQMRIGSCHPSLNTKDVSFCTSYDNPGGKTTPLFDRSPRNAENPLSKSWRDALMNREVKCLGPKSHSSDRPLYLGYPETTIPDPFLETYAMPTWIGVPAMNTPFPEMAIPRQYPVHPSGLVSAIPPAPMQYDPLHCRWHPYGLDMNGAHDLASRISAAPAHWLLYMGAETERMNSGYPWSLTP